MTLGREYTAGASPRRPPADRLTTGRLRLQIRFVPRRPEWQIAYAWLLGGRRPFRGVRRSHYSTKGVAKAITGNWGNWGNWGNPLTVILFTNRPNIGVVEQAGEPEAQVQVARLDLAQVVEDGELQRLLVQDEGSGMRQQHLVGEPGEGGGKAGSGRRSHGVNITLAEKCLVSASPGPAPGRVQPGAGGVLTGLVGVAGCSKGRRGRNVRQRAVTSGAKPVKCSANFFGTFCRILHRGADVAATHRRRPALRVAATRSFLDTSYSERTTHPEGGDLAGAGAITPARPLPSGTSLAHTGFRRRSAWDGPGWLLVTDAPGRPDVPGRAQPFDPGRAGGPAGPARKLDGG